MKKMLVSLIAAALLTAGCSTTKKTTQKGIGVLFESEVVKNNGCLEQIEIGEFLGGNPSVYHHTFTSCDKPRRVWYISDDNADGKIDYISYQEGPASSEKQVYITLTGDGKIQSVKSGYLGKGFSSEELTAIAIEAQKKHNSFFSNNRVDKRFLKNQI